jgi:folate-binding protein YgfZ
MDRTHATSLKDRAILVIAGEDRLAFLQGLVSNDVTKANPSHALWSAFLTPQGKFLHEFFIHHHEETLLLDAERARLSDLRQRLSRYKLRAKVEVTEAPDDWTVVAVWGPGTADCLGLPDEPGAAGTFAEGRACIDPRLAELGARLVLPQSTAASTIAEHFTIAERDDYDALRLALGVPDGSRDLEIERSILLENGFDELGGIDWDKGCYIGQELTARTRYRALIKKRLLPVVFETAAPAPGTPVVKDGREVGVLRSTSGKHALALLRLDSLENPRDLLSAGQSIVVERPPWLRLQEPAS